MAKNQKKLVRFPIRLHVEIYAPFVLFVCYCLLDARGIQGNTIETEDEGLLNSYNAASEAWMQQVSFYGNYVFKRRGFYSKEDAFTKFIDDKYTVTSGIICKLKDKYRLQVFYIGAPTFVQGTKLGAVAGRSIEAIANKNYHIHFYPEQGTDFLAEGLLSKRHGNSITKVISNIRSLNTPLIFFVDPIANFPKNTSRDSSFTVTQIDGSRERLVFTATNSVGKKFCKEVLIRTNENIPVIEQMSLQIFANENAEEPELTGTVKAFEWKQCNGVSVPSCIRAVSGPLHAVNIPKDTWLASEWRSEDLGNRPPTDADFILQLPPDIGLAGMNHYPKDGLVDIDAITDEDFITENDNTYYGQETWPKLEDSQKNGIFIYRWIAAIAGIILIVWGLYRLSKKEK